MTGPAEPQGHVCQCGHNRRRHEVAGFDGECVADGCRCTSFYAREVHTTSPRPVPLGQHNPAAAAGGGPTIQQLIRAGRASSVKRTVAIADRLDTYARDLIMRLNAEREAAALETRLATDRAILTAPMPTTEPLPADQRGPRVFTQTPATCEDCGEEFPSGHKKGAHRRHNHPQAAAS